MAYPTPPSDAIPTVATDTNYSATGDDWDATPTKVAPSIGVQTQGFVPGDLRLPMFDNYLFSVISAWLTYIVAYLAELLVKKTDGAGTVTDSEVPRFDGTGGNRLKASGVIIADTTKNTSGIGTITYGTAKVRTIVIGPNALQPAVGSYGYSKDPNDGITVIENSAYFMVDLGEWLNDRCTITAFGARVNPGGPGRAGANRMSVECWRVSTGGTQTQIDAAVFDDGGPSTQTLASAAVSVAVDRSANWYSLSVKSGNDASSNPDAILYAYVTVSEAGPGLGT